MGAAAILTLLPLWVIERGMGNAEMGYLGMQQVEYGKAQVKPQEQEGECGCKENWRDRNQFCM
jgi:hypothetical protein